MGGLIIMEQTFNILPEKDKKEALEKGKVIETQTVKYLLIEENDD